MKYEITEHGDGMRWIYGVHAGKSLRSTSMAVDRRGRLYMATSASESDGADTAGLHVHLQLTAEETRRLRYLLEQTRVAEEQEAT